MQRRKFLQSTGVALAAAAAAQGQITSTSSAPNILVILVDQLRVPRWFPAQATLDRLLPNLARIRKGSVSFGRHYTASNACTPARACLVTGLYTHQTAMFATGGFGFGLELQPGFPTFGSMLRSKGYQTNWYGKWHLSNGENLEPYGFGGGTFPDPIGTPGQGVRQDAGIVDQFAGWYQAKAGQGPWCTTVSLVNPHDIAFFPRLTNEAIIGSEAPRVFESGPPNIESPVELIRNRKPRLQRAFQNSLDVFQGVMPLTGAAADLAFARMLDWYLYCQQLVDTQVGRVLDTLESNSAVAANTIVLFTADHGEYGGSHGLRNKGAGAYEEAIHVPFYVKDRRGILNRNPELERNQITSHVDVAALLLTMATGGSTWRQQSQFAQIAGRADMASILVNPGASGRSFAIHATDEPLFDEFSVIRPPVTDADHVIALIHPAKKFATYSFWKDGSIDILARGMELESYDYSSEGGRLELDNVAYSHPAASAASLSLMNTQAIPNELRQPLPANLKGAQHKAFEAYFELLEALGPLA